MTCQTGKVEQQCRKRMLSERFLLLDLGLADLSYKSAIEVIK